MPLLPVSFYDPTFCSAVLSYDLGENKNKKLSFRWKGLVSLQNATKIFLQGKIPFFFFWWYFSGKFLKRWEYQTTLRASWEICMQVKEQQLQLNMEQQTGSKLGKEYLKAVHCRPAHLISMQSTSCEMPGWMKHKLESRLPGEISDMQMKPSLWQKAKKNQRASWWKWNRRVKKLA